MATKIGLVLALDGEAEFTQGMKNATNAVKNADTELKALSEEYKDNSTSLEYLTQKQELLKTKQEAANRAMTAANTGLSNAKKNYKEQADAVEDLAKQLDEAKEALEKMDKSSPDYASAQKDVEKLSNALSKQTANYLKAEGRLSSWESKQRTASSAVKTANSAVEDNAKYMDEAAQSADKCAHSLDGMGDEAKDAANESKSLGTSLKDALAVAAGNLAADAIKELGNAAKEAAEYVVETGSEFEASMSKVAALSGASQTELDQLSDKAQQLGRTTVFSATDVADAFGYMSLAGWDVEDSLEGIDGILNLAAASEMDLADASDMVTDYLSAFGMEASQASEMADMLAYAQANSNTTAAQLGEAYKNSAANLNAAGQDIETVTSLLEAMANQGLKGSEAGTALSAIMRDITKNMEDGSIAIGDTTVQVMDAQGNYRDLTDILTDVEAATNSMGDAEKASALQATFTSDSIKGLNLILNEGMGATSSYEDALRNCDGAAADMAATMQDNLQGSLTAFESATSGLATSIYDKIKGPLKSIVDFGTDLVNSVTDIIDPAMTTGEEYVASLDSYVSSLESANSAVDTVSASYEEQAAKVGILLTQYENLTSKESLNEVEKQQLKTVTEQLVDMVPTLSSLYDEESGSIDATTSKVKALTEAYMEQAKQQALINTQQELIETWAGAETQLKMAEAEYDQLSKQKDMYDQLAEAAERYAIGYDPADEAGQTAYATEMMGILDEAVKNNVITMSEYETACEQVDKGLAYAGASAAEFSGQASDTSKSMKDLDEGMDELRDASADAQDKMDILNEVIAESDEEASKAAGAMGNSVAAMAGYGTASQDVAENVLEVKDATEDASEGVKDFTEATSGFEGGASMLVSAEKDIADATEDAEAETESLTQTIGNSNAALAGYGATSEETAANVQAVADAMDKAARIAAESEEIQKNASQSFVDSWNSLKDEASQTLTFSITTEFNGGEDQTTEQVNANLDSQIEGYENYLENLAYLREQINAEGSPISPEFLSYLESQGTDAANLIDHMVWTLQNQGDEGVEQVKGMSDKYAQALDLQDQVSAVIAGDQAALTDWAQSLGSSDLEFDELNSAIEDGVSGADDTMQTQLESLAEMAQTVGATIPEGLTDGIASGDIDASEATQKLTAAIQGTFDGMTETIEENGGKVGEELTTAISDGIASGDTGAIESAFQTLLSGIQTTAVDMSETGTQVNESLADGMSSSSAFSDAVSTTIDEVKSEADSKASEFTDSGNSMDNSIASGITSGQGAVTSAASAVMSAAASRAGATAGSSGQSIGSNLARGIASGISSNSGAIQSAAAEAVNAAVRAAKAAGDIHSPSKKMQTQVGAMLAKGTAVGIKKQKWEVASEAASMVSQAVYAAQKAAASAGSTISDAISNTTSAAIASNFGVASYTTSTTKTKKGKKKTKRTDKDTETYYSDILSAAEKYFSNLEILQEQSDEQELAYWQSVQKKLKAGTQAWYDAQKKINDLTADIADASSDTALSKAEEAQSEAEEALKDAQNKLDEAQKAVDKIGHVSVGSSMLSNYQSFFDMSERATMEYWDNIRKQYKEGTEDRLEADQQYCSAYKTYNEKIKDITDTYGEKIADKMAEYTDAVKSRASEIAGAFNLQDAFESESATGTELLFNIKSQAAGYEDWASQLEQLGAKGILGDDLMQELEDLGPSASATLHALNDLSEDQLKEYNDAYQKKMDIANKQAEKENEDLKKTVEDEVAELKQQEAEELKAANVSLANLDNQYGTVLEEISKNIGMISEDSITALSSAFATALENVNNNASKTKVAADQKSASNDVKTAVKTSQAQIATLNSAQTAVNTAQTKVEAAKANVTAASNGTNVTAPTSNGENDDEALKKSNDAIKAAIMSGTKHKKSVSKSEQKTHNKLWEYLVKKYGRAPTNAIYQTLAKELGISIGKTPTYKQKWAILDALKARGFSGGSSYVPTDMLAYINELGDELAIRQQGDLTYLTAGSAVVPHQLSENLFQWGAINPSQLNGIVSSAVLNASMIAGTAMASSGAMSYDNSAVITELQALRKEIKDTQIYLDSGELVGGLSDSISTDLAARSRRRRA